MESTNDNGQRQNGAGTNESVIFLFDVDGTLTLPRQRASSEMLDFLRSLRKRVPIAIIGGSDLEKIFEQLGNESNREDLLDLFNFIFAENGLTGFRGREQLPIASISKELGEQKCQDLTNFCLKCMSQIELPFKRGTFVEHRNGMINISPCGRSCTQSERMAFVDFENKGNPVREKLVAALKERFPNDGLTFSIGGQISIDIFPTGWDKTYCLRYLKPQFTTVHFFGDKTFKGGNDYEIYSHPDTVGHSVQDPGDCREKVLATLTELGL